MHGTSGTSLAVALEKGHADIVRLLLRHGATIDGNAILGAVKKGDLPVLEALLLNPNIGPGVINTLSIGKTPLSLAVELGHSDVVTLLLNKGATVNIEAIYAACEKGDVSSLELFFSDTTDPEVINAELEVGSGLEVAVENNHLEVVKFLLSKGAAVDQSVVRIASRLKTSNRAAIVELLNAVLKKKLTVGNASDNSAETVTSPRPEATLEEIKNAQTSVVPVIDPNPDIPSIVPFASSSSRVSLESQAPVSIHVDKMADNHKKSGDKPKDRKPGRKPRRRKR